MYYLISIILGLLPEVLYFTLFLIYAKDLKEKKLKLFALITIAYTLTIFIKQYILLNYLALIVGIYLALKLLYKKKTQIIDVFVIALSYLWIVLLSAVLIIFLNKDLSNYYLLYAISRVLLFVPFIFKKKLNIIYKKYCSLWNRNDKEKRPIKSITLRNISLILLNMIIFGLNVIIIEIINIIK